MDFPFPVGAFVQEQERLRVDTSGWREPAEGGPAAERGRMESVTRLQSDVNILHRFFIVSRIAAIAHDTRLPGPMARPHSHPSALPEERNMLSRKSQSRAGRNQAPARIQPSRRAHRRPDLKLLAEELEGRVLLATDVWTGLSQASPISPNWNDEQRLRDGSRRSPERRQPRLPGRRPAAHQHG